MNQIPSILLDTRPLLLLIEDIKLLVTHKYKLITYDIESMYTNLDTKLCKTHCPKQFMLHKDKLHYPITYRNINFQIC